MKYYIQGFPLEPGEKERFWEVRDQSARRIDVAPSESSVHRAEGGENILATLQRHFPSSHFDELFLGPGEYFPCMARPSGISPERSPGFNPDKSDTIVHARATTTGQLHALIEQLEQICRVVHPKGANLQAFGHEIRNVLILACTEVEAHWRTVLSANGVHGGSTRDYVKLLAAMKLDQYKVEFPYYPWLAPIKPFEKRNCPLEARITFCTAEFGPHTFTLG